MFSLPTLKQTGKKARPEYSPTLMHGHCCYSEQRTPNKPKMEERGFFGVGREGNGR